MATSSVQAGNTSNAIKKTGIFWPDSTTTKTKP
jgi:hypothetical protein